ncbi:uncharacterized protein LOC141686355 [Apium graveolens]|uniref:uncharacterized protein LOC141686355 n=1 Tax=Apium graveolens TaxID=4045 RepID=UPI003D79BF93
MGGCRICTNAPSVTHLLFADDSFLFFKATSNEALTIKCVLNTYKSWSGQPVNYQKSAIFFSYNVRMDKQQEIKQVLEVSNDIGDSKYLGLPSLIGRLKKLVFKYLKEKVIQRIKGWSTKLMSRAGKLVLLKNVVPLIPAYAMSCFLLPKTLGQEIQSIMNAFWLRSLDDFCVNSIITSDLAKQSKAREFFKENRREWDVEKVNLHFSSEDAATIVNTRILQGCTSDMISWVHTSNGQYTVKSTYFQWSKSQSTGEGTSISVGLKRLWRLPIPHKIRVFLWRLCRNTISVRNRLREKGVPVTISCPMCVGEVEHLRHIFFECSFSKECWQLVGMNFEAHDMEYVSEWLVSFLASGPLHDLVTMPAVLWGIWYARNKCVFDNKTMSPGIVKS